MNGAFELHRHKTPDAMAVGLASALGAACSDIDHPVLALAGGKTPFRTYRRLAESAGAMERFRIIPTDDRCVPHDHPASNLRGLCEAFGASAQYLPITAADGGDDASLAVAMQSLQGVGPFDAVVLGMGGDGHFASLFPGAANLPVGLQMDFAAVDAILTTPAPLPPEAPFARISLTLPRLLRTQAIHLCITGARKIAVLEQASSQPGDLPYPVAALLRAAGSRLHVHWSP